MMWRITLISFGLLVAATLMSNALFVSWDKNANLTKDDIFISMRRVYIPKKFGRITPAFRNLTSHSLDERCKKGMPLSISWSLNEPYAGVLGPRIGKKIGFAARGIFPSKYKYILHECSFAPESFQIEMDDIFQISLNKRLKKEPRESDAQ